MIHAPISASPLLEPLFTVTDMPTNPLLPCDVVETIVVADVEPPADIVEVDPAKVVAADAIAVIEAGPDSVVEAIPCVDVKVSPDVVAEVDPCDKVIPDSDTVVEFDAGSVKMNGLTSSSLLSPSFEKGTLVVGRVVVFEAFDALVSECFTGRVAPGSSMIYSDISSSSLDSELESLEEESLEVFVIVAFRASFVFVEETFPVFGLGTVLLEAAAVLGNVDLLCAKVLLSIESAILVVDDDTLSMKVPLSLRLIVTVFELSFCIELKSGAGDSVITGGGFTDDVSLSRMIMLFVVLVVTFTALSIA